MTEEKSDEAFAALKTMLKGMAEQDQQEYAAQKAVARTGFLEAIPENAKTVYFHVSHKISEGHSLVRQAQTSYGMDNVLVTVAPKTSGQSFYDNSRDKAAEMEKRKLVIEPFDNFSAKKSIDAFVYLCNWMINHSFV